MKKKGSIQSLNVSPKGFYEGFLLKTSKGTIQVNLPKEQAHGLDQEWQPGSELAVEVELEEPWGMPEHPVYRLAHPIESKNASGKFSGRVERLNYALHGEVNGGILESGDFLHLKPEGARAVGLKPGLSVKGNGKTKPMVGGHLVIEADEVNGISIEHHKAKKKHAK
jgi:hypothetical protein